VTDGQIPAAGEVPSPQPPPPESSTHDARVRRLALEALLAARAIDDAVVARALADADPQVRRLGILAVEKAGGAVEQTWQPALQAGLGDRAGLVRAEALRVFGQRQPDTAETCRLSADATRDPEPQVAAAAFHNLGACVTRAEVGTYLEEVIVSHPEAQSARGWARAVQALHALVTLSPDRGRPFLQQFGESSMAPLRLHAARAAANLGERDLLTKLSDDAVRMVRTAARRGLGLAEPAVSHGEVKGAGQSDLNADDLRRLASPRARLTVRGLGAFDVALVTTEAPAAVLRFVRLAEGGAFDQTMIGARSTTLIDMSPAAHESGAAADRTMGSVHAEPGLWPHVRGTVGLSADGAETGGAQLFVNLVDNPSFDHQLTVFAQVLNGIEIVDRILDGDVIEKVEILP
jgi:cyclophilin family peptidyl-prolyl cis-trans isomerase